MKLFVIFLLHAGPGCLTFPPEVQTRYSEACSNREPEVPVKFTLSENTAHRMLDNGARVWQIGLVTCLRKYIREHHFISSFDGATCDFDISELHGERVNSYGETPVKLEK